MHVCACVCVHVCVCMCVCACVCVHCYGNGDYDLLLILRSGTYMYALCFHYIGNRNGHTEPLQCPKAIYFHQEMCLNLSTGSMAQYGRG